MSTIISAILLLAVCVPVVILLSQPLHATSSPRSWHDCARDILANLGAVALIIAACWLLAQMA